jgi:probable HAF family extracellular repeat protein
VRTPQRTSLVCALILATFLAAACAEEDPLTAPETAPALADGDLFQNVVLSRTDLGTLGGERSFATDVNNARTVVGWSHTAEGIMHAFRWTEAEGMVDLGTLPGDEWSRATAITNDGDIIGLSGPRNAFPGTSVRWSPDGEISPLGLPLLPGGRFGEPFDINTSGQIIGADVTVFQNAWYWTPATGKINLTATGGYHTGMANEVNPSGYVAGNNRLFNCVGRFSLCWRPFLWSEAEGYRVIDVPDTLTGGSATGLGLSSNRAVVGWYNFQGGVSRPYKWSDHDGFTILSSTSGYATAVNGRGTVVGALFDVPAQTYRAWAWSVDGVPVRLSPDDPFPHVAVAIADNGTVAGWGSLDAIGTRSRAYLWQLGTTHAPVATVALAAGPQLSDSLAEGTGDDPCLGNIGAIVSRNALFNCVAGQQMPAEDQEP